ncbi:MAG: hypothetical protein ACT4PZ_03050 [Panacagrimonas sp.]
MNWIIDAGIAMAVAGFFVAAWYRYSRPVHFMKGQMRRAPELSGSTAEPAPQRADAGRRTPSV